MRYADSNCDYTEGFEGGVHTYTFTGPCVVTGKSYSVTVLGSELYAYRKGAKLQDAFRSLSAGDREFLFSGFSPEGWVKTFPDDEDDGRFPDEEPLDGPVSQEIVGTMTAEIIRDGRVVETMTCQNKIVSDGIDSIIDVDMSKVAPSITIDPTDPDA
jgi:hypothetical protein